MKKIKLFETFSGIGAQTKAFNNVINKNYKNKYIIENSGISEWYIDAIIAYAKIHHYQEFIHLYQLSKTLTKKQILEEYFNKKEYIFSSDSKKSCQLKNIKERKLIELYVANIVNKNYGSITHIYGNYLPKNIDIFTYSFPCQAISLQGKQSGLKKDSNTSSSLVWHILRILKESKVNNNLPKILLMENVKALFNKKFIDTWNEIKNILNILGYNTYDTTINAIDKGSIQRRERVFAVSVLKEYDSGFQFNHNNIKNNLLLEDILEINIDQKFLMNELKKHIEEEKFTMKNSGICSLNLQNYTTFQSENILYSIKGKSPTLTASGANSRIKIIDNNNNLRYLTPIEVWKLMGFSKQDFEKNLNFSNSILYRLAGNSIVVEVLEDIFEDILKLDYFQSF